VLDIDVLIHINAAKESEIFINKYFKGGLYQLKMPDFDYNRI
jgi:hypothetical protein